MEDAAAGSLSLEEVEMLTTALVRMVQRLCRRRHVESPEDVADFLLHVLRHALQIFQLAIDTPAPAPLLVDAARLLERLLDPTRELYLYACANYQWTAEAESAGGALAVDDHWTPPLARQLLNELAASGGFGTIARVLSRGVLSLPAMGHVLQAVDAGSSVLDPSFAERACGAVAAGASAALGSAGEAVLVEGDGVSREILMELLSLVHRLRVEEAASVEEVRCGSTEGGRWP